MLLLLLIYIIALVNKENCKEICSRRLDNYESQLWMPSIAVLSCRYSIFLMVKRSLEMFCWNGNYYQEPCTECITALNLMFCASFDMSHNFYIMAQPIQKKCCLLQKYSKFTSKSEPEFVMHSVERHFWRRKDKVWKCSYQESARERPLCRRNSA